MLSLENFNLFTVDVTVRTLLFLFTPISSAYFQITIPHIPFWMVEWSDSQRVIYWSGFFVTMEKFRTFFYYITVSKKKKIVTIVFMNFSIIGILQRKWLDVKLLTVTLFETLTQINLHYRMQHSRFTITQTVYQILCDQPYLHIIQARKVLLYQWSL